MYVSTEKNALKKKKYLTNASELGRDPENVQRDLKRTQQVLELIEV